MQSCSAPTYLDPPYLVPPEFSMRSGAGRNEASVAQLVEIDTKAGLPPNPSVPNPGLGIPKPKRAERPRRPLSILVPMRRALETAAFERGEGSGERPAARTNDVVPVRGSRPGTPRRRPGMFRSFDMTKAAGIQKSSSAPGCYVGLARQKIQTP
jgi:hypothetical protein